MRSAGHLSWVFLPLFSPFNSSEFSNVSPIFFSALLILHEADECPSSASRDSIPHDSACYPILGTKHAEVATLVATTLCEKLPEITCNLKRVSPWGLYTSYQAGVIHIGMMRESGSPEHNSGFNILQDSLRTYGGRWRLAGGYFPPQATCQPTRQPARLNLPFYSGLYAGFRGS